MKQNLIPRSPSEAQEVIRLGLAIPPAVLDREGLQRIWNAIFYLHPRLHFDGFEQPDTGWPVLFLPLAQEVSERYAGGELFENEVYPSDAQHLGMIQQMHDSYMQRPLGGDHPMP
jgi:hypothetical protein